MKYWKVIGLLLLISLVSFGQQTQFVWDPSPDVTTTDRGHNFYVRTNGITDTNFYLVGTLIYPTNEFTPNLPLGVPVTLYVAATDYLTKAESAPSNLLDWINPFSSPPPNILTSKSIASYNPVTKIWSNVTLSWNPVDFTKYALTNYMVYVESASVTNKYSTTNNTYTIPTLIRDNYKLYVLTLNNKGYSQLPPGTIWAIDSSSPKSPLNLKAGP